MRVSRIAIENDILPKSLRPLVLFSLGIAFLAVAMPNLARAQEWRFEPIIKVGAEYDDNADLDIRTDEEVSLSGGLLDLSADIKYSSENATFLFQPTALIRKYDESDFDSEDYFLRSDFNYTAQSSTFAFRAFFDQQAVRTAERANSDLEIEDPDDLTDDDTGRTVRFGDRSKWRLVPKWDYRLSNISSIGAQIDYFDVQYDDVIGDTLDDYTDTRLNLNYRRNFSNVNTGLLTVTGRRYDSENVANDTDGYGIMAGFEYALSTKTRLMAMVGFEDTDQSGFDYDPEVTANVTLTRNLETISVYAQYRRSVNASGAGELSIRDSLNLNFRRRLSERVSAGVGIRAYQSSPGDGSVSTEEDDRDYIQLQSSFLWYLTPAMVIEADYRYTINDRQEVLVNGVLVGERANSNQVNLWFIYQPRTTPKL